jgi:hypothetical protein
VEKTGVLGPVDTFYINLGENMKRLICAGCGLGENLNDPTGTIHTMQFVDKTPQFSEMGQPDKTVEEDLCTRCRDKIRREFFGIEDAKLLEMPFMKAQ